MLVNTMQSYFGISALLLIIGCDTLGKKNETTPAASTVNVQQQNNNQLALTAARGSFEGVNVRGVITGWADFGSSANAKTRVEAYIDGELAAATIPNISRTGCVSCGYNMRIPDKYRNNANHSVVVYIVDAAGAKSQLPPGNGTISNTFSLGSDINVVQPLFDLDAAWGTGGPAVLNNQMGVGDGVFRLRYWGKCADGEGLNNPIMSSAIYPDAANYTGVNNAAVSAFTCPNFAEDEFGRGTFVNVDNTNKVFGIYLNTARMNSVKRANILVEPSYVLPTPAVPWSELNNFLEMSWEQGLSQKNSWYKGVRPTGGEYLVIGYNQIWLRLQNPANSSTFLLGLGAYDARDNVCSEWIGYDEPTHVAMVSSCQSDILSSGALAMWKQRLDGPSVRMSGTEERPLTRHAFRISSTNLKNAINAYNAKAATRGWTQWATDDATIKSIKLMSVGFNPEIALQNRERYTTLRIKYLASKAAKINIAYQTAENPAWRGSVSANLAATGGAWQSADISLAGETKFVGNNVQAFAINPLPQDPIGSALVFGLDKIEFVSTTGLMLTGRTWNMSYAVTNARIGQGYAFDDASNKWFGGFSNISADGDKWTATVANSGASFQMFPTTVFAAVPRATFGMSIGHIKLNITKLK